MSKELDYITELERKNRLLGERCNQLLKDKGDLTDQIADIKANCDLAIEGRDVKIMELEKENAELKHNKKTVVHLADCLEEKMKERIEELEQQIEKMKCCENCQHFKNEEDVEYCWNCERQQDNDDEIIKDEWEIKE